MEAAPGDRIEAYRKPHDRFSYDRGHRSGLVLGARDMSSPTKPSPRKLIGIALILLLIVLWSALVAAMARFVGHWPVLVQALFYLVMGLIWIAPLKPLVRWMQTGRFRGGSAPPR
jgi:hypothetical protein